jgi:hypothetical protein
MYYALGRLQHQKNVNGYQASGPNVKKKYKARGGKNKRRKCQVDLEHNVLIDELDPRAGMSPVRALCLCSQLRMLTSYF